MNASQHFAASWQLNRGYNCAIRNALAASGPRAAQGAAEHDAAPRRLGWAGFRGVLSRGPRHQRVASERGSIAVLLGLRSVRRHNGDWQY